MTVLGEQYRILVAEKIADTGVDLLRERFAVDVATAGRATSWRSGSRATTGS